MTPEDHDRSGELRAAADAASRHASPIPVAHIKTRAARRTRRRSALAGLAAIALIAGAVTVAANSGDRDGTNVITSRPKTTTTTEATATTQPGPTTTGVAPETTLPVIVSPTTIPAPATTRPPQSTTTTTPPPSLRYHIEITAPDPGTVAAGQEATFEVVVYNDGPTAIDFGSPHIDYGDNTSEDYWNYPAYKPCQPGDAGPSVDSRFTFRHAYQTPGTFTVVVTGQTCGGMGPRTSAQANTSVDIAQP
jgi:hypothetical protein